MKVLMIGEGMDIGGCETHIYELIRGLRERGHEIVLLCQGGRYAKALEKEGVRVIYAPTARRTPWALLCTAKRIKRALREHFDVVHTHTRGMSTLTHSLTKIAHTVTVHLNFPVRPFQRALASFGDHTLAVSEDIRSYLEKEYGKGREEISLTCNGVDMAHLRNTPYGEDIVHLSRLDHDRSLCALLLCRVAPLVLKRGTKRIHIFGDGDDFALVEREVRYANAKLGRCGVILHEKTEDIRSALALGNIFVGVSRALLEAMAAGRASIVCGNEGYGGILKEENVEELRKSNFCARGCPKASGKALARDLSLLIQSENERATCAALGQEVVERYYMREHMVEDALEAYRRSIDVAMHSLLCVGFFGCGNFGDALAEHGILSLFPKAKVFVSTRRKKGSCAYPLSVSRFPGTFLAIFRVRAVIFGGGTLFQNETSTLSLLYYALVARIAFLCGREVLMLGGGVDHIRGSLASWIARRALCSFSLLGMRTKQDLRTLKEFTDNRRSFFFPDLIFLRKGCARKKRRRCALVLKGDCDVQEAISYCKRCASVDYEVVLVSLFDKEDGFLCDLVAKEASVHVFHHAREEEVYSLFASCEFVISYRLHGALASLLSHTLCFLNENGEKLRNFIQDIRRIAALKNCASPLFPFQTLSEFTREKLLWIKKEAVGRTYGFEKIIGYYKHCLKEAIRLIQQRESLPWEPSSCRCEQQHQEEPSLPWTSREHPQEPHAEPRW